MENVGISYACERAMTAIVAMVCREEDGMRFASWIADTYGNDTVNYVDSIPTSTLYGRFLDAVRS